MLARKLSIAILLLLFHQHLFPQAVELKKKEVDDRLLEIQEKIDAKEYEAALGLLNSKTEILLEENIPKKSLEQFAALKDLLGQKEELFKQSQAKVDDYEQKHRNHYYCESVGLLDLELTNENAFQKTIAKVASERGKYEKVRARCEANGNSIRTWKEEFDAGKYEQLFNTATFGKSEMEYLFEDDAEAYSALKQKLFTKQTAYNRVKDKYINAPSELIKNINYDALTFGQAEKHMAELNEALANENQVAALEGNNPELKNSFQMLKADIKRALARLEEYKKALFPVKPDEVSALVNSDQPVTLPFVKKQCRKIEKLGGASFEDNKLLYLYNQDVFYYYHSELSFLQTPEQKETYRQSDDFKQKTKDLARLKAEFDETVFYVEVPEAFRMSRYDPATKSFKIKISTDKGNSMGEAQPPKCINKIDISYLDFASVTNSSGAKDEYLLVPADEATARKIEQNSKDASLFFLFKIKYLSEKVYKFSTFSGDADVIKDPVFTPSFLRVIAANNATDEIYHDKFSMFTVAEPPVAFGNVAQDANTYRGVVNETASTGNIKIGEYYALIIGIDNYAGAWPPLKNGVNDAKALEQTLKQYYWFDHFKTLYDHNATLENIIRSMEWLVSNVKEDDNVLIYYSGHGEFNKALNKGYWVPIDAQSKSTAHFISNSVIQDFLKGINSKHTLLLSDACFSGDIFRGSTKTEVSESSEKYFNKVYTLKSRQAISSGGVEPVLDGGSDGHSVFAYYLLQALKKNTSKYFDAEQLYSSIKVPVVNNSNQSPIFSPVKDTGDEGGQFIFIKKE